MPASPRQALRIVVQYLGESERYRLIAYGDAAVYRPLEFRSRAAVFGVLGQLVAGIDENLLAAQEDGVHSRIVFAADVNVGEPELRAAGLVTHP